MSKFKVITRDDATKQGLSRFYTGKQCRFGHVSERYVTSGNCIDCDKRRATRNQQKYRAKQAAQK